jgi:hypothetical protein
MAEWSANGELGASTSKCCSLCDNSLTRRHFPKTELKRLRRIRSASVVPIETLAVVVQPLQ